LRLKFLFYAAAVSIGLAGIQHLIDLVIDPEHSGNISIATFFIIAGVAQIFWALPTARRWGKPWYYIGIAGNVALIVIWMLSRMPGNPITEGGQAEAIGAIDIPVEISQAAYIGLVVIAAIVVLQQKHMMMRIDHKEAASAADAINTGSRT
jgi:hypothetical protein